MNSPSDEMNKKRKPEFDDDNHKGQSSPTPLKKQNLGSEGENKVSFHNKQMFA
jgi:hypothetical protein